MDNKKLITLVIVMLAANLIFMFFFNKGKINQPQQSAKPAVTAPLETAKKQAAGNDKGDLKKALETYNAVVKADSKSAESADARLQIGLIYEKQKNDMMAVKTYAELLRDAPASKSATISQAKAELAKIDEKNSHSILYKVMHVLVKATGSNPNYSYALALLLVTVLFKIITTPLSHKQFKSMKEMQKVAPLIKDLQEKYKGDQKAIGEETMKLYKEHKINPFAGCLPLLIQLPVLWLLFLMVRLYQVQFADAHFLWIGSSLASKFPTITVGGMHLPFIGSSLALPDMPLLVIYVISMIFSQKLSIVDPSQAEQQKMMMYIMPVMMAFFFWTYPSAFMLYWLLFNVISTVQQYYILRPAHGMNDLAIAGGAPVGPGKIPAKAPSKKGKNS